MKNGHFTFSMTLMKAVLYTCYIYQEETESSHDQDRKWFWRFFQKDGFWAFIGNICLEGKPGQRQGCLSTATIISILIAWQSFAVQNWPVAPVFASMVQRQPWWDVVWSLHTSCTKNTFRTADATFNSSLSPLLPPQHLLFPALGRDRGEEEQT